MSGRLRVLAVIPAWNEGYRVVERVIARVPPEQVDTVLLVDDGSDDDTAEVARAAGAEVLSHPHNRGVGAAIRTGIDHARATEHDVVVVLNAAGKFDPADVAVLLDPLRRDEADLVQGSRYAPGGSFDGAAGSMPRHRRVGTVAYSWLFSALLGRRVTDGTSGIRAFRTAMVDDPGIDLYQDWLDRYELEPYLLWSAIARNYRVVEVPIRLHYPDTDKTRMRAGMDWWRIARPMLLLRLGRRR